MNTAFSMTLKQAANAMGARYQGEDVQLQGVSTDTRSIKPGELFVALIGPNFDGHDYLTQAREKGALACMVSVSADDGNELQVEDTRLGLGKLARVWREQLKLPVITVTGSNGKTTVKEMLASILKCKTKMAEAVLATRGNLNNDIGLPLTLLKLNEQHQYAVIEMGANHPGEIKYLSEMAQPDIAVVTNAGAAHLEGFGSLDGVAKAKGEAFTTLRDGATAIVNADDAYYSLWQDMIRKASNSINVVTFGLNKKADVSAHWQATGQGSKLEVRTPQGEFDVKLNLLGEHNVMNALAAVAASIVAGVSIDAIQTGLSSMQVVPGRLELKSGINGSRIIDDTYNANPTSLTAAIRVLKTFPGAHYLALGDMGELGTETKRIHQQAGVDAKNNGVNHLYAVGSMASAAAETFGKNSFVFDTHQTAINSIQNELNTNVTLLVKGSRLSHMEYVVDALTVSAIGD
jgi:UDP-N-acetylmuramoyl-tripeptide--D-alanyl-D-alanine ligase